MKNSAQLIVKHNLETFAVGTQRGWSERAEFEHLIWGKNCG